DPSVPGMNDHIGDVGIPEGPPHGHGQELRVLAERPELTGKAEIRREGAPSLLELLGDEAPVLSDIHPRLKDEEGHHDGDDGPEHPRTKAREPSEPATWAHAVTGSSRSRLSGCPAG